MDKYSYQKRVTACKKEWASACVDVLPAKIFYENKNAVNKGFNHKRPNVNQDEVDSNMTAVSNIYDAKYKRNKWLITENNDVC